MRADKSQSPVQLLAPDRRQRAAERLGRRDTGRTGYIVAIRLIVILHMGAVDGELRDQPWMMIVARDRPVGRDQRVTEPGDQVESRIHQLRAQLDEALVPNV